MAPKAAQKQGAVPELLVKKRKRDDAWAAKREAAALDARKKARAQRRSVPPAPTDSKSSRSDGSVLLGQQACRAWGT